MLLSGSGSTAPHAVGRTAATGCRSGRLKCRRPRRDHRAGSGASSRWRHWITGMVVVRAARVRRRLQPRPRENDGRVNSHKGHGEGRVGHGAFRTSRWDPSRAGAAGQVGDLTRKQGGRGSGCARRQEPELSWTVSLPLTADCPSAQRPLGRDCCGCAFAG